MGIYEEDFAVWFLTSGKSKVKESSVTISPCSRAQRNWCRLSGKIRFGWVVNGGQGSWDLGEGFIKSSLFILNKIWNTWRICVKCQLLVHIFKEWRLKNISMEGKSYLIHLSLLSPDEVKINPAWLHTTGKQPFTTSGYTIGHWMVT